MIMGKKSLRKRDQCCMVDPSILTTLAFRLIEEDFKGAIEEGLTYMFDICWKLVFQSNFIKLHDSKYQLDIYNQCAIGKSHWICENCHILSLKIVIKNQIANAGTSE